jgi:sec-independent protein translocase protein TatA
MFGMSGEHLLVLLVILLIFGPRRLPELGHSIGRTLKNFKDGMNSHVDSTSVSTTPAPYKAPAETSQAGAMHASEPVAPVTPVMATPAEGPAANHEQRV